MEGGKDGFTAALFGGGETWAVPSEPSNPNKGTRAGIGKQAERAMAGTLIADRQEGKGNSLDGRGAYGWCRIRTPRVSMGNLQGSDGIAGLGADI